MSVILPPLPDEVANNGAGLHPKVLVHRLVGKLPFPAELSDVVRRLFQVITHLIERQPSNGELELRFDWRKAVGIDAGDDELADVGNLALAEPIDLIGHGRRDVQDKFVLKIRTVWIIEEELIFGVQLLNN